MHQNVDDNIRNDHRLSNDDKMRDIFKKSGKVRNVFQGHYHKGTENMIDGIKYITLKAMCENEKAYYIIDTEAEGCGLWRKSVKTYKITKSNRKFLFLLHRFLRR